VLQCVAVCRGYDTFRSHLAFLRTRRRSSPIVCCSVLQCVAVCCSVLQCVVVCCSVLQCSAVYCAVFLLCGFLVFLGMRGPIFVCAFESKLTGIVAFCTCVSSTDTFTDTDRETHTRGFLKLCVLRTQRDRHAATVKERQTKSEIHMNMHREWDTCEHRQRRRLRLYSFPHTTHYCFTLTHTQTQGNRKKKT